MDLLHPGFVGPILTMLIVAAVILLWPLSRKSAELIELMIDERRKGEGNRQLADMAAVLNRIENHLESLEERQSFTEALVSRQQQPVGLTDGADPNRPRAAITGG